MAFGGIVHSIQMLMATNILFIWVISPFWRPQNKGQKAFRNIIGLFEHAHLSLNLKGNDTTCNHNVNLL